MPEARRETAIYGAFRVGPRVDEALARLALAQHAVFALEQLVGLGLSARAVRTRAATARLHRIHHGVYGLAPPELLSRNGRYLAAVLACGPGAALSHRSAGALLDLVRSDAVRIDVSVATLGGRRRRPGIRVHRTATLSPADTALVNRIPCTTVGRTLLDLAGILDRRGIERALDQAAILELFDLTDLRDQIRRNRTRPGASALQAVLAEHVAGSTPTWNDLEELMIDLSRKIGLPDPEVQQWLDLGDGEPPIRADFLWREQRLIVETDGYRTHGTRTSFERDRRRDQRALAAGWRTIRITWRQLQNEPQRLGRLLLAVVAGHAA